MSSTFLLIFVGAFISFLGSSFYLKETLVGRNKPNRVSLLLWGLAPLIAVAAAWSEGVRWAVLPVFMAAFFPLLTFFASFWNQNAYWKLTAFDFACGFFSLLALLLWAVTRDANVAILFALLSDGLATVPTIRKVWIQPESETTAPYFTTSFNQMTTLLTLPLLTFGNAAFLLYTIVINTVVLAVIYRRKLPRLGF